MGDADDHMGLGYSYGGQQQQQQQYGNEEQQRPPALPPPPQNIASGYYGGNTDRSDHGRPHEEDYPPSRAQRERADSTWSQNDRGRDREGTMLEWVEVVRLKIIDGLKDTKEADLNKLSCETLGLRRRECLDKLKERKRIALLKNLEYVARVEDERLQDRLARVQEAQEYHYQLEDYHNQVLELRSTNNKMAMNALQAGIGTEQRQRAEKKRKQNTQSTSSDSLAIYVSNLPTDGSVSDDLMRALFGSYGNLRKIHLYRDKQTGELKGDALIIYSLGQARDRSSITEAVCSQVRQSLLIILFFFAWVCRWPFCFFAPFSFR